ncbi:MAG TPA: hypothetical protein VMY87_11515, partial [Armatimonadota bacterium]|nr:hypothetical protein [Armatimonadota bacterium]
MMQSETGADKKKRSAFSRLYPPMVGLLGWLLLVWLVGMRVGEGVGVSLVWEAGFFLGLAILVGLQPVRLPRGAVTT